MQYELIESLEQNNNECLVIGLLADKPLSESVQKLDQQYQGIISLLAKKLQNKGEWLWQSEIQGKSLLLIHCGKLEDYLPASLNKRLGDIASQLLRQRIVSATLCLPPLATKSADWQLEQMVLKLDHLFYQLLDFKKAETKPHLLEQLSFFLPKSCENSLEEAKHLAEAIRFCRTLADLPANLCTPSYLAEQAKELARQHPRIHSKITDREGMRKLGMGALLAVAQGSEEPPQFIEMHYQGKENVAPIVLVGKGITFDCGGLTIKPGSMMDEMKYDMAGAATVFAVLKACALLELPLHVIGLVPSTENMINGRAVKPGDIVTSLSGQTIEIMNTDAEGRLILADALSYAERFNPEFVIDIATLTGAMIVALGCVATGFMTHNERLASLIEQAALESQDKAWRMPLDDEYQEALISPMADMINAGFDRSAGGITAACFLSRFTKKYPWAHMDIAGTSWVSGKKRQATGRPVPLITHLLRQLAHAR